MSPKDRKRRKGTNPFRTTVERLTAWFLVGIVVLSFPLYAVPQLIDVARQLSTSGWTETQAFMFESSLTTRAGDGLVARVKYRYDVEGAGRPTDVMRLSTNGYSDPFARRVVSERPIGATVEAYYDPGDPERAVLIRGLHNQTVAQLMGLSAGVLLYALVLLLLARALFGSFPSLSKHALKRAAWSIVVFATLILIALTVERQTHLSAGLLGVCWLVSAVAGAGVLSTTLLGRDRPLTRSA